MKPKGKVLGKGRELILTPQHRDKLQEYTTGQGGFQNLCARVHHSIRTRNGQFIAVVYEKDMQTILEAALHREEGGWQALFAEIMDANQ